MTTAGLADGITVVCIMLAILAVLIYHAIWPSGRTHKPRVTSPRPVSNTPVPPPAPKPPTGYEWGKQRLDDLIISAEAELRRLEREAGLDEW